MFYFILTHFTSLRTAPNQKAALLVFIQHNIQNYRLIVTHTSQIYEISEKAFIFFTLVLRLCIETPKDDQLINGASCVKEKQIDVSNGSFVCLCLLRVHNLVAKISNADTLKGRRMQFAICLKRINAN